VRRGSGVAGALAVEPQVKPAPFEYAAPRSLDEALGLLGEDARPLAGGQSLVPLLNFRLARPALIVDLNRIAELAYLDEREGSLRIGAMTRHETLERSELVAERWSLLREAVRHVAHPAIRSRGTVGGSAAHADPAAEVPVALTALEARFHVRSVRGSRTLAAEEFFLGALTSALEDDELLIEIEVPPLPEGAGSAFIERARTHGDWAMAGAAVTAGSDGWAAISLLRAGPAPRRAREAEAALAGGADAAEAAALAAGSIDDEYLRALSTELVRRAIERARS
jgi:CO/xanthine dehydrogenase FAD-binding subunit